MDFLKLFRKFKYTDTRMGTDSVYQYSTGNTLPYMGEPFGMNYFCVQSSRKEGSWWFNPNSSDFEGFRLTHQPSPWMGDFSNFTILPVSKLNDNNKRKYDTSTSQFFQHYNEIYFIDQEGEERASITASSDSAIIKYEKKNPNYILEGENLILEKNIEKNIIQGYVQNFSGCEDKKFKMYIVISLKDEFEFEDMGKNEVLIANNKKNFNKYIIKAKSEDLYISTSFISLEQALYNHELMPKDFEIMLEDTKSKWDYYLNKFDVDNLDEESLYDRFNPYDKLKQEKFFYHCVYRSFLFPMKHYEISPEGEEIHYDTTSKKVKKGKLFTNMGMWDLHKTLFPLFSLIDQDIFSDILEGLLNQYRNTGYLPKWMSPDERGLMPGTLVDNVIAEAISKDISMDLMDEFLEAMIKGAEISSGNPNYGRAGVEEYKKFGYVPNTLKESVNQTLDNSLSDYSIYLVAKKLGKEDIANKYYNLSKNYKNLFDKSTGFMRDKDINGNFDKEFDPLVWGSPYTEGSAYQNSFNVYHDIEGLIELYGGEEEFREKLDELSNSKADFKHGVYGFEIHEMTEFASANFGQIAISNQPSFHIPYLYNYVNEPKKTQLLLKELYLNYFQYDFKAYPGDEDNGSMSAWYILSTMGLYPICPGTNEYHIGMPFFNNLSVELYNSKKINIKVNENYHQKKFIKSIKVDGKEYKDTKINWDMIKNGVDIEYTLGLV